jgi:hypothetical protein
MENNMPFDKILEAASYAFLFRATDENGVFFQPDVLFRESLAADFQGTMVKCAGMDPKRDFFIISQLEALYKM